jgi:MscS family membrane protein
MDWQVLNEMFLGNSLRNWIVCGGVLLFTLLFNHLLAKLLSKGSFRFFKRFSDRRFHTVFTEILHKPFVQLINLLALYLAFQHLRFPESWNMAVVSEFGVKWIINVLYTILLIFAFSNLFLKGVEFWEYVIHHQEEATISPDLATFIKRFAQVIIFVGAFFTILAKAFEVNITAVVTSLGIGGLAIALAAQDTLANLIASFIIYLDKPFKVGEIVELGDIRGVVEKIGFRTTRIRTFDKSLLIVPNKKIIDSNLNNISQSNQRRVRFNIGLTYQSTPQNILQIIEEIKKAISAQNPATAEEMTVRFVDFDSSSLSILVIYYVNSNEYEKMVEVKEKINVRIMEIVAQFGCSFAYPTQTLFLNKES